MKTDKDNDLYRKILAVIASQDIFKTFINAMPSLVFIKDTQGRFIMVNKATSDFLCVGSPDEVIGRTDFDFYPEPEARAYSSDEQEIIKTGKSLLHKAEPRKDKKGTQRSIYVTKIPVRDEAGIIIGTLGFSTDLTEQKLAEEKLKEERCSLRTLIDTLPDYIYAKDTQSRFILSNMVHARHMGANSPDDIIGKTDFDFYPKDIATSFYADEQEIMRSGKPLLQKDEINTSMHGCTARVLTSKIPLKDSLGNVTGIVGIGHDITSLSKMERNLVEVNAKLSSTLSDLQKSQDQMIQSERLRALGQMASGITHDFNNALTPILGYSDLLLNGPGILDNRETTVNMLNDIRTAAIDAAQTVRRLSEFYAPARKTERKAIEVDKLIESTINLTRPRWKEEMAAKGIDINVVTKLERNENVFGNESQLREMLTNLIFNAVDAMPKGGTLTMKCHKEAPFILIEVSDTGTGMTKEVQDRCFEPFFSTKHRRGGGLGLAMVHGIVRQHSGEIEIKSVEGRGTSIFIRIPQTSEPVNLESVETTRPVDSKPLKVLLIDDEEIVRQAIEVCLKSDRHSVSTAADGKHGLDIFAKNHFDIVITDRAMPGINGDNVAAEIKKINPKVPVIMLTGFGHIMHDLQQCPPGVDLLVSKPVTRDSLRDSLEKALSHMKR